MQNLLAVAAPTLAPAVEARLPQIEVALVTTESGFAALASQWNDVHEQAIAASVFNSWTWQYHWWQMYGHDRPLRILVATHAGQIAGVLALYVETVRILGVPVRIARLVGTGGDTHPDDLGPVLSPRNQEAVACALMAAALGLPEPDVFLITDIDGRSVFPRAVELAARRAGLAGAIETAQTISYSQLPATWGEFLARLNGARRTRLLKNRKRFAAQVARFFVWEEAAALDLAVDRLTRLHRMRWAASGASASFASQEYVEFHRRIIKACFPRGWLRLYCLEIAGEVAAITYCYRFRNRIYLMQAGFDPAWAKWNPGGVLLGHAFEHAIGEGNEVFDFLRGKHRYKDELATGTRETVSAHFFRSTPRAYAYRATHIWLPRWKARIRSLAA